MGEVVKGIEKALNELWERGKTENYFRNADTSCIRYGYSMYTDNELYKSYISDYVENIVMMRYNIYIFFFFFVWKALTKKT